MEFLLADEEVNGYGFRLLMSGGRLDRFIANPVMFFNHKREELPIGKWDGIRVENGKLIATPVFDEKDDEALEIQGKVDRGFLKGASVSISPISVSDDPTLMMPGQSLPTITEWEVEEASIVGIPGSKKALKLNVNGEVIDLSNDSYDKVSAAFTQLLNSSNKSMKRVLLKLSLAESATEEQAVQSIAELQAKVQELTRQLDEARNVSLSLERQTKEALVDDAIAAGRIPASSREDAIQAVLNLQLEQCKSLLLSLAPTASASNVIKPGDKTVAERNSWSIRDWEVKDPNGLLNLKLNKPTEYSRLFEAFYGEKFVS
jgi:hypothetical protein